MTIYKPKPEEKKAEKKTELSHSKIVIPEDEKPLATKKKPAAPVGVLVLPVAQRRRRGVVLALSMCVLLVLLIVVAVSGVFLFRYINGKQLCTKTAEFRYYEYQTADGGTIFDSRNRRRIDGQFMETIELDIGNGLYERIEVPPILNSLRSTVVHDFDTNWTAIADHDNYRCFVMPLNRGVIKPPKDFYDLMEKYESGYYLPDAELVHENYKVQLPAVIDMTQFGIYIAFDCRLYDTYKLVSDVDSSRVAKRSACEMNGDSYCLGEDGGDQMICVQLTGCM